MLLNYLKIAFRSISKHRLFTAINIISLAMSMSLGLLIMTLISDLLSYDNFHVNGDNIYRVTTNVKLISGNADTKATCPFPVADELEKNFPGYQNITRIQRFFSAKANANNKDIQLDGYFTEPSFLEMFSFPLLAGNNRSSLLHPNSVVLTKKSAQKFFGQESPIGKVISMGLFGDYIVAGIISDPPPNSHLKFDMLGSFSSLRQLEQNKIVDAGLTKWEGLLKNYVYLQKKDGLSEDQVRRDLGQVAMTGNAAAKDIELSFQPQALKKIIPGPDLSSQPGPKMSYLPIFILTGVALLILLSACINYTNLSLARALRRSKEIGVRKAIGGSKRQLFAQFLSETFAICMMSLVAAYFIFRIVRPEFLKVVPRAQEMFTLGITPLLLLVFLGFAFFTALLAGIIPASVLSGFNVIRALRSDTTIRSLGRINMRKALIVFQFAVSLIFIVGIIVIYRQYKFSMNYDHGFSMSNKTVVSLEGMNYSLFKNEFEKNSKVQSVTGSSAMVGGFQVSSAWANLPGSNDSLSADFLATDENFIENLNIRVLAGTGFGTSIKSKEQSVIINEQMAKAMGAKQLKDALGKLVIVEGRQKEVIGIVEDFNYAHLEEPIKNFIFFYDPEQVSYAYLTLADKSDKDVASSLNATWSNISANRNLDSKTMEIINEESYSFYTNFIKIFGFVAFLAITIGCLGLIGMSLYHAQSRVKEIGIRKVMGASAANILFLLSKGFVWLLLISSIVALPVSYFLFSLVLENGVYHIQIGIVELGAGLLFLLFIGGITIVSQTWKAAIANPVTSLRTE